jgi:malto-oligosyltrehalose synthase/4-alpha-glucanotransferase
MFHPITTYRIQFQKAFTFADAMEQLEYFRLLGIGSVYASPVFKATPGSKHGYDVSNPLEVNPEIASGVKFKSLTAEFKRNGIGWVQDIVPNHMAYNEHNDWLWDVMEKGCHSLYASWFDVYWGHAHCGDRIMAPFLGEDLDSVLADRQIRLEWYRDHYCLNYFDNRYPLKYESWRWLMKDYTELYPDVLQKLFRQFPAEDEAATASFLNGPWEAIKMQLATLVGKSADVSRFFVEIANGIEGRPDIIKKLVEDQHYLLCHWKETEQKINYRRFFTVNDLICLRMEDREVFDAWHATLLNWVKKGMVDGLRVDHVDGLLNPADYLQHLRSQCKSDTYIIVEKILEQKETLPNDWPVQGTSGYDFLAMVNNLMTDTRQMTQIGRHYQALTTSPEVPDMIMDAKQLILNERMAGELDNLADLFSRSGIIGPKVLDKLGPKMIRDAIATLLTCMPVYRFYTTDLPLKGSDRAVAKNVFADALQKGPKCGPALKIIEDLFLNSPQLEEIQYHAAVRFMMRCMQITGPLMAKGVEDTTMYRYNGFIAHNEVGDSPMATGMTTTEFHKRMALRMDNWPLAMNSTSTHDTKRGEDVRARLNVLSEMGEEWTAMMDAWLELNQTLKVEVDGQLAPSIGEEFLIYQTLVGIFPFNQKVTKVLLERLDDYLVKALREAKENTSWSHPNEQWEEAVVQFVHVLLDESHGFLNVFVPFQEKVASFGILNSLSQLALKMTCPGVPDIYQGTELWDLTLVDPDNRQDVDYTLRNILLRSMNDRHKRDPYFFLEGLWQERENGHVKLWLTSRLMHYRREWADLFEKGSYIPLKVLGKNKKHILAFARYHQNKWHLTVVPLMIYALSQQNANVGSIDWVDTRVVLPPEAPDEWRNVYAGTAFSSTGELLVGELFAHGPVSLLQGEMRSRNRAAGVLLHVTSLASPYAMGDFGPSAYRFVDWLKATGHTYWQVLPFTPVTEGAGWSPYSTPSAMAGNTMFISPEILAEEGMIERKELEGWKRKNKGKVDFSEVQAISDEVLTLAWHRFRQKVPNQSQERFEAFCAAEKYWLDDYVLFVCLKEEFNQETWNLWPEAYKIRDEEALSRFVAQNAERLNYLKFGQFVFARQWLALKRYANYHEVKIIGDMPIYVSYDNADVWAHPQLFKLEADKSPSAVAGVPPDYFSATGQLWNMPVYDWGAHKKEGYNWWVKRIQKNLDLYDQLRLDHFRGFEAYWEVPAGEPTAVNGRWVKGPGRAFFRMLKNHFPKMPFIAEDLGDIDEAVLALRDAFGLPGMRVLQFAWGHELAGSVHAPHNYPVHCVAYTGTHDNNTSRGWLSAVDDKIIKKQIGDYTGVPPKRKNVHEWMTRMVWASVAQTVIVPMQDILGLDESARMNEPSVPHGNWSWRLKSLPDSNKLIKALRSLLWTFGRSEA